VAKIGRAEVLRELAKPREALAAYDSIIAEFPESVVARTGRAGVLRDLGKPQEALAAYDSIIVEFPESVVAKNSRAEVLRDLGKPREALAAYDSIIAEFPENVVAKNGRANVLSKEGRFEEALNLLPYEPVHTLQDWVGFHMRGVIYMRQGRLTEAQRVFRLGCEAGLPTAEADYFRLALAISQLRLGSAKQALEDIAPVKSRKVARARSVIRAHALGEDAATEECQQEIARIHAFVLPAYEVVANEIEARYVHHAPHHYPHWLIEREEDLLLAA
jgi:tetratricopeptide (TPR) repeat protein